MATLVTRKGQVTIPKRVRDELWRNLGDEVVRRRCVMSAR
jgi:AbrB family looped-hinge helix DNA binding protein